MFSQLQFSVNWLLISLVSLEDEVPWMQRVEVRASLLGLDSGPTQGRFHKELILCSPPSGRTEVDDLLALDLGAMEGFWDAKQRPYINKLDQQTASCTYRASLRKWSIYAQPAR